MLRLAAFGAILVVLVGVAGASAGTPSSLARSLGVASREDPRAGRPFVGYVLVLPAAAQRGLLAVDASCPGTVLGRTVPGRQSRVPAGAPLPAVLVCTWSIPRDRVGWTFRARMDLEVWRRLADGSIELATHDGRTTAWIIQPS